MHFCWLNPVPATLIEADWRPFLSRAPYQGLECEVQTPSNRPTGQSNCDLITICSVNKVCYSLPPSLGLECLSYDMDQLCFLFALIAGQSMARLSAREADMRTMPTAVIGLSIAPTLSPLEKGGIYIVQLSLFWSGGSSVYICNLISEQSLAVFALFPSNKSIEALIRQP